MHFHRLSSVNTQREYFGESNLGNEPSMAMFLSTMKACSDVLERTEENDLVIDNMGIRAYVADLMGSIIEHDGMLSNYVWRLYEIVHIMYYLGVPLNSTFRKVILDNLCKCRTYGGYGGGPGLSFLGTSNYAAACILYFFGKSPSILLKREFIALMEHLLVEKDDWIAFRTELNGEYDMRTTYSIIMSAHLFGVMDMLEDTIDDFYSRLSRFIVLLQRHDGGFAPEIDCEAHAGYTYCAIALSGLLGRLGHPVTFNKKAAKRWIMRRQCSLCGGFNGRPQKLPDSCYSYWLGACVQIMDIPISVDYQKGFLLLITQQYKGFTDHPPNGIDPYHTFRSLSALQWYMRTDYRVDPVLGTTQYFAYKEETVE
ncbi:hypothetical protein PCE1_003672 [Barthelona sp. PCE]